MGKSFINAVGIIYNLQANKVLSLEDIVYAYKNVGSIFKKNAENRDIIDSVNQSGLFIVNNERDNSYFHLNELKNNNEKSFYVLPMAVEESSFIGVIKKINDKYLMRVVGLDKNVKVAAFNSKSDVEKFISLRYKEWRNLHIELLKNEFEKNNSRDGHYVNIPPNSLVQGESIIMSIFKGIKVAMLTNEEIEKSIRGTKNLKLKWYKEGNILSSDRFKNKLVDEYENIASPLEKKEISKLKSIYNFNKLIESSIKDVETYRHGQGGTLCELNDIIISDPKKISFNSVYSIVNSMDALVNLKKENRILLKEILDVKNEIWKTEPKRELSYEAFEEKEIFVKKLEVNKFVGKKSQILNEFHYKLFDIARTEYLKTVSKNNPDFERAKFFIQKADEYSKNEKIQEFLSNYKNNASSSKTENGQRKKNTEEEQNSKVKLKIKGV